jgi:hypothetical protein
MKIKATLKVVALVAAFVVQAGCISYTKYRDDVTETIVKEKKYYGLVDEIVAPDKARGVLSSGCDGTYELIKEACANPRKHNLLMVAVFASAGRGAVGLMAVTPNTHPVKKGDIVELEAFSTIRDGRRFPVTKIVRVVTEAGKLPSCDWVGSSPVLAQLSLTNTAGVICDGYDYRKTAFFNTERAALGGYHQGWATGNAGKKDQVEPGATK